MSLQVNLQNLATRIATETKSLRTLINGNASDLSALTTSTKTHLVAAINELDAAITALEGGGSASTLDDLTDVAITSAAVGHILRHNGTNFVNVLGTTHFDAAGSAAAAQAASQPVDSDLTAIAALTTTSYGRTFLTLANQAALMALLASASTTTAGIVELATTEETTTGTDTSRAVTPAGVQAALNAVLDGAPAALDTLNELAAAIGDDADFAGTVTTALAGKQPLDTDLTAIAGLTSAANKVPYSTGAGTWAMADFSAAGRTLVAGNDAAAQRTALDVYSKAEIGDPETDFVAVFEAGLV